MAWYRLYRPQKVSELALAPVREYLQGVLKSGRYAHAYIFAGPKGTGKTSAARILARILNDPANSKKVLKQSGPLKEPDSDDPILQKIALGRSQVVLEQDAASHRGIDDIRLLQEQISVVPSEGLIRVVILDEVHMLTTEAFNALLKMLEEPPERVVFVLATTEPHKIPATVQSRCEVVRFRQATPDEITAVLDVIAKQEKIKLSAEARQKLIVAAQGSFRDAVKYFEAVVQEQAVDEEQLKRIAGSPDDSLALLKHLAKKDVAAVSGFFQEYRQRGLDSAVLEQAVFYQLQERLHRAIERPEPAATISHIARLLGHLADRVGGYEPIDGLKLELACLDWCLAENGESGANGGENKINADKSSSSKTKKKPDKPNSSPKTESSANRVKKNDQKPAIPLVKDDVSVVAEVEAITDVEAIAEVEAVEAVAMDSSANEAISAKNGSSAKQKLNNPLSRQQVESAWNKLLLTSRTQSPILESLLRNASLGQVANQEIEVCFDMGFHQEKLESPKYKDMFKRALTECFQAEVDFRCSLVKPVKDVSAEAAKESEDQLIQAVESAVMNLEDGV